MYWISAMNSHILKQHINQSGELVLMGDFNIAVNKMSHGSVVVSKHDLYVGSLRSIPTAVTTMTVAGGDAEHVSLNH